MLVELSLSDPESEWFDNVETVEREDRATVMRQSFLKAVDELTADLGPGMNSWTWGSRNRMVIPDLLKDPKRAQSVEAVPGNRNTVIPGGAGGAVTEGSVYRMVVPLGDVQRARGASPGVQSGVPAGENADQIHERQLRAYLSGDYVPLNYYPFFGDFPADDVSQILAFHPKDKRPLNPPPGFRGPRQYQRGGSNRQGGWRFCKVTETRTLIGRSVPGTPSPRVKAAPRAERG